MISTRFITQVAEAFPNAKISVPVDFACYLVDVNGAVIGHLCFRGKTLVLYTDYEFYKQAREALMSYAIKVDERESDEGAKMIFKHLSN